MLSDLESRVLRIENENSKMICVESRVTKLESLVLRDGKGNSKLRCADLHNSETIESEALGSQNDVCEKQRDKNNMSKPNAETSKGENKDSHMYELKTEENVLKNAYDIGQNNKHHELESAVNISSGSRNLSSAGHYVKQGKGWGRGEETPSQAHSEMSKKPLVKLVSDNSGESVEDDSDSSDSKGSLSDHWDRVEMKCRNRNNDREIKWKFEADMLSSFEEDPELCAKAVCALYRHQISAGAKGLFHYSDALRGTTLAKFLMDGACEGDLKKSIKELETLDSKAVEDCKRLARSYSKQLFSIYQKEKDPYFLPAR
ncbi:hypothetical protein MKX03_002481 [Papaver bracteatum]|nr:hypothetical protein MKX03_002481 [Papaver bracteatum]